MTTDQRKGISVLVLEDDFYLADDIRSALQGAGATVMGPCSNVNDAIRIIDATPPHCAILDMNLGNGPNFETARVLKALSIPFVLSTGYDASVIPEDLAERPCLAKPVSGARLISAIAGLVGRSGAE